VKRSSTVGSDAASPAMKMRARIAATIRKIPRGKVSSYGAVAQAAGYPGYARQVGQVMKRYAGLPWHRVLGAGGAIKVPADDAIEQRMRLQAEGVGFRGRRVHMALHEFKFAKTKSRSR
jgi:methylated-DNA-protein-cysteine methyltransferase related protein